MPNFITTLPKLTSPTNYSFWKICVKSTLALIIYLEVVFTTHDMLNTLELSQTTNVNDIARRSFLDSQTLAVLNSTLPDNLLMYNQPNTKALQAHSQTLMEISGPASIFADYQRTITFQISGNQDPASQIAELDSLETKLHGNNCDIPFVLILITLLSAIPHSWDSISASILFSHTFVSNLILDVVYSVIQAKFFRQTNTTNATCYSSILCGNKLPAATAVTK